MIPRDSMKLLDRKCARETRSGYLRIILRSRRKDVIADDCDIKNKMHATLNIFLDSVFQHSVVWITSSDYLGHSLSSLLMANINMTIDD